MKFREHRGLLCESMATLVDLPDRAALVEHCRKLLEPWGIGVRDETIWVVLHQASADKRNGWPATYTVTVTDYGVLGFVDRAV